MVPSEFRHVVARVHCCVGAAGAGMLSPYLLRDFAVPFDSVQTSQCCVHALPSWLRCGFGDMLRQSSHASPYHFAYKALALGYRGLLRTARRVRDRREITFSQEAPGGKLLRYFAQRQPLMRPPDRDCIRALADHYLDHRFSLLGSGWVQVRHGIRCAGLEGHQYAMGATVQADGAGRWLETRINPANLPEARLIWSLVEDAYTPIDWHLDFKSGYRWSEATWYLDVPFAHEPGVDIKVPWELARMQHLPQLAWAYAFAADGLDGFKRPQVYTREFRNQVLDFIATNPPRFGVNWRSTMDVAIRVANWLVAFDLFRGYGAGFDGAFEDVFTRSVFEHRRHIVENLEWHPRFRGNHYLSNIVGLLFTAAYLPCTPETNAWLTFAIRELGNEVAHQFNPDGANFEASTSYHRLAAEMVVYATALVLGLPQEKQAALSERGSLLHRLRLGSNVDTITLHSQSDDRLTPFSASYAERLEKMAEFTQHITKSSGHIPQIGDNDSGRFFKLQPTYHRITVREARRRYANLDGYVDLPDDAVYWDENGLDHRHLVAAINGLFRRADLTAFAGDGWVETAVVWHLAGGTTLPSYLQSGERTAAERVCIGGVDNWENISGKLKLVPEDHKHISEIHVPGGRLREGLRLCAYPHFGLYLYQSSRLFLAVRCGSIGQDGVGGHAHNDQLSLELTVDGYDWIADPGTYLYTPLPWRRNEYRSVKAHFAQRCARGREPGRLDLGLFRLGDEARAECLYFGSEGFVGRHQGFGRPVYRMVQVLDDLLRVVDYAEQNLPLEIPPLVMEGTALRFQSVAQSPGYGVRCS